MVHHEESGPDSPYRRDYVSTLARVHNIPSHNGLEPWTRPIPNPNANPRVETAPHSELRHVTRRPQSHVMHSSHSRRAGKARG